MLPVSELEALSALPNSTSKIAALPNGLYAIEQGSEDALATDATIVSKVWLRTPVRQNGRWTRGHSR